MTGEPRERPRPSRDTVPVRQRERENPCAVPAASKSGTRTRSREPAPTTPHRRPTPGGHHTCQSSDRNEGAGDDITAAGSHRAGVPARARERGSGNDGAHPDRNAPNTGGGRDGHRIGSVGGNRQHGGGLGRLANLRGHGE